MPEFKLRFDIARVPELARRYQDASDLEPERTIGPAVRKRGYYERDEFIAMCRWKSPRTKPLVAANPDATIQEATAIALRAADERVRIGVLQLLDGVSWPTASVLLHFGHRDPYPILDFRALEALGSKQPGGGYSFEFWWAYVEECRRLAHRAHVDMRTLDRALWQWSKERA